MPLSQLENFSQIFTVGYGYAYLGLAIASGITLFFASLKFLLSLQQSGYKNKRYYKWLSNKKTSYRSRLMLLSILGFLFSCVLSIFFEPLVGETVSPFLGFISYFLFVILYINTESSVNAKVPLNKTKRLVRLSIVHIIFLTALSFGVLVLCDYLFFLVNNRVVQLLRYSIICFLPIILPALLAFTNLIVGPLENAISARYVRKATAKLDQSKVIKIGITGSYGKTSVKEILKTILSQKYRVLATPSSYNTPLGIALAVKNLDSTHDVFIAEMGARSVGDVKVLADMVKPFYGVITGINSQHLETFGSVENVKRTKFELIENLAEGGEGFFSSDSEGAKELFDKCGKSKSVAGISGEQNLVSATNISTSAKGMKFMLNVKGEQPVECTTVLLGNHSVSNICLAAAVAYKIGLTPREIASGINRIQPVNHRLELVPNNQNIVIIDDSYNSNENGVKAALEVLSTFEGRKIVFTPGLVELGKIENLANYEFGKVLAQHADLVFVIGKHNAEMLITGLLEGGMDRERIKFASSLNKGNAMLNKILVEGDVVLFENDLPDNYE